MIVPTWIKILALVVVIGGYTGGVFWLGGEHSRKVAAQSELVKLTKAIEAQQKQAKRLQETIDNLPRSSETIREIVRQNPAPCARPKPVSDGLSEAIRKARAARKVSRHP